MLRCYFLPTSFPSLETPPHRRTHAVELFGVQRTIEWEISHCGLGHIHYCRENSGRLWTAVAAARGSVCVHASVRMFRGKTELRCASHTLILSLSDDEGSRSRMMELDWEAGLTLTRALLDGQSLGALSSVAEAHARFALASGLWPMTGRTSQVPCAPRAPASIHTGRWRTFTFDPRDLWRCSSSLLWDSLCFCWSSWTLPIRPFRAGVRADGTRGVSFGQTLSLQEISACTLRSLQCVRLVRDLIWKCHLEHRRSTQEKTLFYWSN